MGGWVLCVTGKLNPNDVDVVSFFSRTLLSGLGPRAQAEAVPLLEPRHPVDEQGDTYHLHNIVVVSCPPSDPYWATYESQRRYWRKWFGTTRPIRDGSGAIRPGLRKGIVEMVLGDVSSAPDVSHERTDQ